jgi:selenocysteine lyase/cysteine desulfurase
MVKNIKKSKVTRPAKFIHLCAAGASPSSKKSHAAYVKHLELERAVGGYIADAGSWPAIAARKAVGRLLNCSPDEVALTQNAQQGWTLAFKSIILGPNDRVIMADNEYAGNAVAA